MALGDAASRPVRVLAAPAILFPMTLRLPMTLPTPPTLQPAITFRERAQELAPDALAIAVPLAVGAVGGIATAPAIPAWYRTLRKPSWNPPDAVFGPVWTTLYVLMGVALVLARRAANDRGPRLAAVFGLQLALNLGWSLVFFGRRDIGAGLAVIVLLWAAIVATIAEFSKARPLSAALLLPYLGWVTFAAILNAEVWRLNR